MRTTLLLVGALLLPRGAAAQAWTPQRGEITLSLTYQHLRIDDHLLSSGQRFDAGRVFTHGLFVDVDYGITEQVAISAGIPFISSRYSGNRPHQASEAHGHYNSSFQDFVFDARVTVARVPVAVAPFVSVSLPSHDYEFFAHSAVGTNQRQLAFGLNAGQQLGSLRPWAYYQARYAFGIVERVQGIRPNRSNLQAEFGYILNDRVAIKGIASAQFAHAGLNFPEDYPSRSDERWRHHDQTQRISYVNIGPGVSAALSSTFALYGTIVTTVWGRNGHALTYGLTMGANWTLRQRRTDDPSGVSARASRLNSAPRCGLKPANAEGR